MITIDDKEYRNLQEQVGYLTEELKKLKQSLGSALPEPIEGPQGPQGETGATGPQGRNPKIGFGFGPLPEDDSFQDGDIYIARSTANGLTKGNMYKKINGSWQLQLNIVGPQGPIGPMNDNEVTANPSQPYSDFLEKIEIDGIIYGIPTGNFVRTIDAPESATLTDQERNWIINGVFVNGELLGYKNPILLPATKIGEYYIGVIFGPYDGTSYTIMGQYQINPDNAIVEVGVYGNIELKCIKVFNGAQVPVFPSSPVNPQVLVYKSDNTLEWQNKPTAGMTVYKHSVDLSTPYSGFSFTIRADILSTDNEAYTTVDEVWNKLANEQTILFGGKLAVIKSYGLNGMDIAWVDEPNTTISISKASTTFNSDIFNSI